MGVLVSAPILRIHPGYLTSGNILSYSLETADQLLSGAGYLQPSIGASRNTPAGKTMRLRVGVLSGNRHEAIEKIISDSVASLGIEMAFVEIKTDSVGLELDGVLAGIALPWPSLDLFDTFHSKRVMNRGGFPFYQLNDQALDESLFTYREALTKGQPRFDLLSAVHARLLEVEPWSVLESHQVCLAAKGIELRGRPSLLDPDWFRRQVVD